MSIPKRILVILLIIIGIPFHIVFDVFRSIHASILLIINVSEGKSFVDFAEREIKKHHERALKDLEDYKD